MDVRGEVIGINSAIASQTGYNVGYAFAIPIDLAKQVMNQLITKGRVERAALGVLVQDATPADAKYVGLDEIRGVRVDNFPQDGSPAKTAGIQQGDVIIAVDGQPVEYVAQLQQLVGFRKPGDVVKVEVARKGGVRKTYNVHLIAASEPRETKKGTDGREDNHEDSEKGTNLERIGLTVVSPSALFTRPSSRNPSLDAESILSAASTLDRASCGLPCSSSTRVRFK